MSERQPIDPTAPYAFPPFQSPHILLMKVAQMPECGCRVEGHGILQSPARIIHCAMHAAAAESLAALKDLVLPANPEGVCHVGICSEQECRNCRRHARGRAAIAKAERLVECPGCHRLVEHVLSSDHINAGLCSNCSAAENAKRGLSEDD